MQAAQLFADAVNPGDQDTFRSYLNGILYRAHRGEIQGRLPTTREPLPTDGILPSDYVEKLVFTASDIRALAKIYDLEILTPGEALAPVAKVGADVDAGTEKLTEAAPKKRVLVLPLQQESVISVIRKLGHDPLRLPDREKGKRGVRAEVTDYLLKNERSLFQSQRMVRRAWDELRKSKQILGGK